MGGHLVALGLPTRLCGVAVALWGSSVLRQAVHWVWWHGSHVGGSPVWVGSWCGQSTGGCWGLTSGVNKVDGEHEDWFLQMSGYLGGRGLRKMVLTSTSVFKDRSCIPFPSGTCPKIRQ